MNANVQADETRLGDVLVALAFSSKQAWMGHQQNCKSRKYVQPRIRVRNVPKVLCDSYILTQQFWDKHLRCLKLCKPFRELKCYPMTLLGDYQCAEFLLLSNYPLGLANPEYRGKPERGETKK